MIGVGARHDSTMTHYDSRWLSLLSSSQWTKQNTTHLQPPTHHQTHAICREYQKRPIRDRNNDSRHPEPKQQPSQIPLNSIWVGTWYSIRTRQRNVFWRQGHTETGAHRTLAYQRQGRRKEEVQRLWNRWTPLEPRAWWENKRNSRHSKRCHKFLKGNSTSISIDWITESSRNTEMNHVSTPLKHPTTETYAKSGQRQYKAE